MGQVALLRATRTERAHQLERTGCPTRLIHDHARRIRAVSRIAARSEFRSFSDLQKQHGSFEEKSAASTRRIDNVRATSTEERSGNLERRDERARLTTTTESNEGISQQEAKDAAYGHNCSACAGEPDRKR
jgi:hypothetical protein